MQLTEQDRQDLIHALSLASSSLEDNLETVGIYVEGEIPAHIAMIKDNFKAQISRYKILREKIDDNELITIGEL